MDDRPPSATPMEAAADTSGYTFDRNTSWHAWVEAYDGVHPLADRGAAYGTNTTSALQRAPVVAIDMDIRHLDILRERTPPALRPPLETISGKLPDDLHHVEARFSSILVSEVLHFLSPHDVTQAFEALWRLLIPGGRLVLTALSLYNLNTDTLGLVPELAARCRADVDATAFPGWFPDFSAGKSIIPDPYRSHIPNWIHFFSAAQLHTLATRAGFEVELACMARPASYPPFAFCDQYAQEQVGLIAHKPGKAVRQEEERQWPQAVM